MKVSLNWLRELVELPPTVPALVDLLTLAGVEVEGVASRGCAIPNVVVAQIKESVQHPNADRLSVCQVDDGSGTARQIVCGAKNYQVGDKVPLALPGAKLGPDFTIKVGKLRGVESQGMLCSAEELGLPKSADGLLILSPEARVGAPIAELFAGDTILDLEITPNRADLLSHAGIAREIGALTGKIPVWPAGPQVEIDDTELPKIALETGAPCYYTARHIRGVKVGPSPDWLRAKIESIGLRAINNVVDVTNYVMHSNGQPLHAFNAAKLRDGLRVRHAREGEQFLALDGKTYVLSPADLVIADAEKAVAIAGVMGGVETGVTEETMDVVLESAYFDPATIRRTSRRLGLSSDSSYRFERGVNTPDVALASFYAARLIGELGGAASVGKEAVACSRDDLRPERAFDRPAIPLRAERLAALLGLAVPAARVDEILAGFDLRKTDAGWVPPARRRDLTREVDLIEEIARVVGIDSIPGRTQARFAPASASDRGYDRAMTLRRAFAAQGLHEARSLTLVPAEPRGAAFTRTAPGAMQRVKNPMIDDQVVLRPNLMHGLLEAVARNIRAGAKSIRLFEIGRTFLTILPEEFSHAAIVLSGPISERSWRGGEGREADLFDLKGIVTAAIGGDATFEPGENPALALSITIKIAGQPVGLAGQLWPADARALDATAPLLFAELDLAALAKAQPAEAAKKYGEIPRFPATARDIAMLAPIALPHEKITTTLAKANEPLLTGVELFDVFTDATGEKVPADKKSVAYSLTYRAADRTLTSDEVNAAHTRLKQRLTSELGVTLRE